MRNIGIPRPASLHSSLIWRAIPSFPDWYVSENGVVKNPITLEILRQHNNGTGVTSVKLGMVTRMVPRLILEAFVGPPPGPNCVAWHKDRNLSNCHIRNLRWMPRTDMQLELAQKKDYPCGESHKDSRLTKTEVLEIRCLFAAGKFNRHVLAMVFGVSDATIGDIAYRRTWAHLPLEEGQEPPRAPRRKRRLKKRRTRSKASQRSGEPQVPN